MINATTLDVVSPVNEVGISRLATHDHAPDTVSPADDICIPEPDNHDQLGAAKGIMISCGIGLACWAALIVSWIVF
jgi:hypothetical protein